MLPVAGAPATERVLYPGLRYAHVDLSKSGDATGLCVAHVRTKKCRRMELVDGRFEEILEEACDWTQAYLAATAARASRSSILALQNCGCEFRSSTAASLRGAGARRGPELLPCLPPLFFGPIIDCAGI
jgi:hypothetical protein